MPENFIGELGTIKSDRADFNINFTTKNANSKHTRNQDFRQT